ERRYNLCRSVYLFAFLTLAHRLEDHASPLDGFLSAVAPDRHALQVADQTQIVRVGLLVAAAALRRAGEPVVLLVNLAGLEFHVILLAPAERDGIAQDHVRFLFTLVDVDVTLEFPLLLQDGELVIRRQEVIFAGD